MNNTDIKNEILVLTESLSKETCSYTHIKCINYTDKIMDLIERGAKFDCSFIDTFLKFITTYKDYYYYNTSYSNTCITRNPRIKPILKALFANNPIKNNHISIIFNYDLDYLIPILVKHEPINPIHISEMFNANATQCLIAIGSSSPQLLLPYLKMAIESQMDSLVMDILKLNIIPSEDDVCAAIKHNKNKIVSLMMTCGAKPSKKLLIAACISKNADIVRMLLDNKIIPDKECFEELIKSNGLPYTGVIKGKMGGLAPPENNTKIIDLLVTYGYNLTYNDVILATRYRIFINNIDKYDFVFDDTYLKACANAGFYPYKIKAKPSLECLEIECSRAGNLETIKEIIKSGIKPNSQCLESACNFKNNLATIKYLILNGANPTINCIKNMSDNIGNSGLSYIIDTYIAYTTIAAKPICDTIVNNKQECVAKNKKEKKIQIKGNKKIKEIMIITEIPQKQIDQRAKLDISNELKSLFSIKNNEKFSFIEIRKKFIEYFDNNDLYDKENKLLIKIDKKISESLNIDKDKYLNFNDLDNFIGNILNQKID